MDQGNFKRPVGSLHFISENLNSTAFFFNRGAGGRTTNGPVRLAESWLKNTVLAELL